MNPVPHPIIHSLKWTYAENELQGIAEAIGLLVARSSHEHTKIGVVAPNYTWATQMQQACKRAGIDATVCIAIPDQARVAQQVFAALALLIDPADTQASETLLRLGVSKEAQDDLVKQYSHAHGLTLIHGLQLDTLAPFSHALRHRIGDEDAAALSALLHNETATPSMQRLHGVIPLMDYASLQGTYDWLFFIGCVEGLLPASAFVAYAEGSEELQTACGSRATREESPKGSDAVDASVCTTALRRANNVVISHFTKISDATAQAFKIVHIRTKREGDQRIALTRCCPSVKVAMPTLPTTEGGQAFLNRLRMEHQDLT